MILTPPLSAELTILAYAFKLLGTLRSRVTGAIGRAANSSSLSFTLIPVSYTHLTLPTSDLV